MSFATRCTACGTIFRVVQDQLRVSEGWVRCGRCAEVFDARVQLFDIDRDAPPPWPQSSGVISTAASNGAEEDADAIIESEPRNKWPSARASARQPKLDISRVDELEFEAAAKQESQPWHEPEPGLAPAPDIQHAERQSDYPRDSRLEPQWASAQALAAAEVETSIASIRRHAANLKLPLDKERIEPTAIDLPSAASARSPENGTLAIGAVAAVAPQVAVEPSFMRGVKRENYWRKPAMRVALGMFSLFFLLLLGLQISIHFHNAMAALYPAAKPGLQLLCQFSACEIQPWQRIAAIQVESSNLSQAATGNHYRLAVTLRNKSAVDVAAPWLELSLTDASGALVARRMLAPKDLGAPTVSMPFGADLALQAVLATGDQRISGYSIEVFHP